MRLTLIGCGTRGDVQPMLCLAWALRERGHEVTLLAPENMRAWIERARVPFAALPVDVQALFAQPAAQHMLARGDLASFFKWLTSAEKDYSVAMSRAVV